jgi:hypothetical protein
MRHIWPALSVILPLLLFLFPFDQFTMLCFGVQRNGFKQRLGLLKEIAMVLISPFSEVTFMRSFIGDIFCSMPRVFTDMQYTICIYATGSAFIRTPDDLGPYDLKPHAYYTCGAGNRRYYSIQIVLLFLPYFIRLCQSLRAFRDSKHSKHLWNGLKYFLSLMVTGLAFTRKAFPVGAWPATTWQVGQLIVTIPDPVQALEQAWIVMGVIATLYSWYWDVVMDWGLGHFDAAHFGLRDELFFRPDWYYISIAVDFVMRLGWAFVISPDQIFVAESYMLLLGAIELTRRSMWAIFRVEWEYIKIKAAKRNQQAMAKNAVSGTSSPLPPAGVGVHPAPLPLPEHYISRRHSEVCLHRFMASDAMEYETHDVNRSRHNLSRESLNQYSTHGSGSGSTHGHSHISRHDIELALQSNSPATSGRTHTNIHTIHTNNTIPFSGNGHGDLGASTGSLADMSGR